MSSVLRIAFAAALLSFLAWQAVMAAIDLGREAAAASAGDRKRALVAPESERIERSLAWIELYWAIERHVPEEAIVGFCFPLTPATFGPFYQVVPLVYPRRAIPITQALPVDTVEGMAEVARKLSRPSYIVDFRTGFPLPAKRSQLATGRDFTLWRVER